MNKTEQLAVDNENTPNVYICVECVEVVGRYQEAWNHTYNNHGFYAQTCWSVKQILGSLNLYKDSDI